MTSFLSRTSLILPISAAATSRSVAGSFDIRRFHDVLLSGGSLPLDVLEDQVARYIAAETAGHPPEAAAAQRGL